VLFSRIFTFHLQRWEIGSRISTCFGLIAEHGDGRFARGQTGLCGQVGNCPVRRTLLPQLREDIVRRNQFLELLRVAWREFFDRFANCGWIK
jgi:hypothetical protein